MFRDSASHTGCRKRGVELKVLLAEDDPLIRRGLAEILNREGYSVVEAGDGDLAVHLFHSEAPDFVCLDIMMPKSSGYDACKKIRAARPAVPIIFISAKSEEIDKVVGLEMGADDYIVKPFGVKEVIARIRAVTRRCYAVREESTTDCIFRMGDLEVFPRELRARRGDTTIELSLRDIKILQLLNERRGQAIDRHTIFNQCWGEMYLPNSRTLDQHISQLRKRIELSPKTPTIIRTVHGVGYRFDG
jgi:two-component system, OmpR family, alkaline phosphatase synthesis response regulator PhoP